MERHGDYTIICNPTTQCATLHRGVTVTLSFDGSDAASWSTSNGKSSTVDLTCGG